MRDNDHLGADLGRVTKWAFAQRNKSKVPVDVWMSFNRLRTIDGGLPFEKFLEEMGLDVLYDIPGNWFVFLPAGSDSEFRLKNEDIRSRLTSGKSSLFSFALIAVAATFYPTKMALSSRQIIEITPEKVYATARRFASYVEEARSRRVNPEDTKFDAVVTEFTDMPETDGKTTKSSFQEYYVLTALKTYEEYGWVKQERTGWLPREQFALVCNQRLNEESHAMAALLTSYYDHYTDRV
jgi:hypothetical protein